MNGTLSKAAFSALRWNYLGVFSRSATNLVLGVLLARILGPRPFGELAVAGLYIGVANLLADAGFTSALVQAPTLTEVQIRYVFTVQFLIAVVLTATCAAAAGPMAVLFHDPGVKPLLWAISPTFLIQALGQVSNGILRREMAFRALQTAQIISYVCSLVLCIALALEGAGVWSLVAAQLAQTLIFSTHVYILVRHSVVPSLDRSGSRLLHYGSKVTTANLTNWGISNLDNAVVGRAFGPTSLGLYSRAFNLGSSPAESVVGTVQQVLFAAVSRADRRVEAIRRAYLACLSAVALLIFPAFWSMSACAETVIVGLYGERWRASAALFRPLALALSFHAVMALAGPILNAMDQVRREIVAQVWSLAVAALAFIVTAHISLTALAWGVCATYLVRFILVTLPTLQFLEIGWKDVLSVLSGPSLVSVVTASVLMVVDFFAKKSGIRPLPDLCVLIVVGLGVLAGQVLGWGHLILAPQVIGFLQTGTGRLPKRASSFLTRCAGRQHSRSQWASGDFTSGAASRSELAEKFQPGPIFVDELACPANSAVGLIHGTEKPLVEELRAGLGERSPFAR